MTWSPDAVTVLAGLDLAIVAVLFVSAFLRHASAVRAAQVAAAIEISAAQAPRPRAALGEDVDDCERLLTAVEARSGADDPAVASLCQRLGRLYVSAAEYEKAVVVLERALRIIEASRGADALSVASILDELAILDEKIARHDSAAERWTRALEIRGQRLPALHPDVIWTAMRLGRALCKQEKYVLAEAVLRAVGRADLPPSDDAVLAMSTLAVALAEQGKDADDVLHRAGAMVETVADRGAAWQLWSEFEIPSHASPTDSVTPVPVVELAAAATWRADAESSMHAFSAVARHILATLREPTARQARAMSREVAMRWREAHDLIRSAVARRHALGVRLTARWASEKRTDFKKHSRYGAQRRLSNAQRQTFLALAGVLALTGAFAPIATLQVLIAVVTVLYLASLAFRVHAFWRGLQAPRSIIISDELARSIADEDLPVYTILVPAYHEPEVIGRLVSSLAAIEYPADRLDVKILLEADDGVTLQAARAAQPPRHVKIVRVPVSQPRTKPKALNYGLRTARGELLTIYDAEDRPEPLQLRRAVVAFGNLARRVVCLQAKLSYHNAGQNLLTRWFTAEYATWFSHLLPGLAERRMPLPLGGTSNHFRRAALVSTGGWDPYNVTEDADLGIRLYRAGFAVEVLESTTLEEANSDFINWTKQRSRWYKGYLQTWLVHMRNPVRLWHELGPKGFLSFNLFVGGTPLLTLVSPIFWTLTVLWFVAHWTAIPLLFSGWLYYVSLFSLVVGNASFLYMGVISSRATGRPELVPAMLVAPMYWAMMSIAAIKALVQLVAAPSFWEKTTHGLDEVVSLREKRGAA
jgi:cellulose synthase/poly-beta-1,6-N-acetylglucosamine synthase-like glycosyltransferase/tetratricopeptide (TPR) repeat protein